MTSESLFMGGAFTVAAIGGMTDVASRRIPNNLTYTAMLVAIVGRFGLQGWHGLGSAIAGGLVGGGAFLVFFLIHAMGAGDVKLITAVGCFVGPALAIEIVFASAIAGGILAILIALWQGRLRTVLGNVGELIKFHAAVGPEVHPTLNLSNPHSVRLPYGIAIAAGVLFSVVALYFRGGL